MKYVTIPFSCFLIGIFIFISAWKAIIPPPAKVEIKKTKEKFELYRNGKPYFIKGAGGYSYYDQLKQCGGNSIRLWTVTLGLDMGLERH
jgi:hypothetical protein